MNYIKTVLTKTNVMILIQTVYRNVKKYLYCIILMILILII